MATYTDEQSFADRARDPEGGRVLGADAGMSAPVQPMGFPHGGMSGAILYGEASKRAAAALAMAAMEAYYGEGHHAPYKIGGETEILGITFAPVIAEKQDPYKMNSAQQDMTVRGNGRPNKSPGDRPRTSTIIGNLQSSPALDLGMSEDDVLALLGNP